MTKKAGLTPAEAKALNDKLVAEKNARLDAIKAAQKAYDEYVISDPDKIKEQFELFKALAEAKAADMDAESKSRTETAIAKAVEDIKAETVTPEQFSEVKADLAATIKANEILQVQIKENRMNGGGNGNRPESKSFQEAMHEAAEEKSAEIESFIKGKSTSLSLEIKAVADVSTANVTGGNVWGAIYRPGIVTNPNQIGHIRNYLNVMPAGPGTDYYFMKENGNGEGAPTPVAEKKAAAATNAATGLKPSFDIDLIEASVPFETIAGIMIVSKKAMNNIPNFMAYLNMRIPEKLLDVEDEQLLYGDGNTPNIKGILTAGNYVASTATSDILAERIIQDLALLEDTYKRRAAAVWLRPAQWWEFSLNKADGATGVYNLPANVVWVGEQLYIGGVPVYKTTALHSGDYFIGARDGADLLIQEGIRLEFFNQHASLAATNQIMIRVEETIALPVYGASYHILGSVPDPS